MYKSGLLLQWPPQQLREGDFCGQEEELKLQGMWLSEMIPVLTGGGL